MKYLMVILIVIFSCNLIYSQKEYYSLETKDLSGASCIECANTFNVEISSFLIVYLEEYKSNGLKPNPFDCESVKVKIFKNEKPSGNEKYKQVLYSETDYSIGSDQTNLSFETTLENSGWYDFKVYKNNDEICSKLVVVK
jgi:hypothetical protein